MRQAGFQMCRRYFPPFQPKALGLFVILLGGRGLVWDISRMMNHSSPVVAMIYLYNSWSGQSDIQTEHLIKEMIKSECALAMLGIMWVNYG